jgi:hypothetical protein
MVLVHHRSRSASPGASRIIAVEDRSAETEIDLGGMVQEPRPQSIVLDKGKGRAKRRLPEDTDGREASEESRTCMNSGSSAKKVKGAEHGAINTWQIGHCEDDLAKENEIFKLQLGKANEEVERCRKERKIERDVLLGIITDLQNRQSRV